MNIMQQQSVQTEQMHKWKNEIQDVGYLENESEIIKALQKIDLKQKSNQVLASELLTLIALSIAAKGKKESLVLTWMEKALDLDPTNARANEYLANYEWKKSKDIFEQLIFPPIRETD